MEQNEISGELYTEGRDLKFLTADAYANKEGISAYDSMKIISPY